MTPGPVNAPVKPSALPVIALIMGLVGMCVWPLFPIAIILAIVCLAKSSEPAFATRKTLAIITLVLIFPFVPVAGIVAAIAIPNFIKFQARSKQSECKTYLKAAWMGQKSYFSENQKWGETAKDIGFSLEGTTRYTYRLSQREVVRGSQATLSVAELDAAHPPGLLEQVGSRGPCPDCVLTMTCAGSIDYDPSIDVWSISSAQRVIDGEVVPPGSIFNDQNDLTE